MIIHDPETCLSPETCDVCATLRQRGAARVSRECMTLELQLKEKMAREERSRQHRMNSLPARSAEQKRARTKARAVRKRQKMSRRRNR